MFLYNRNENIVSDFISALLYEMECINVINSKKLMCIYTFDMHIYIYIYILSLYICYRNIIGYLLCITVYITLCNLILIEEIKE
jgi:hypothetical protein